MKVEEVYGQVLKFAYCKKKEASNSALSLVDGTACPSRLYNGGMQL